MALLDRNSLGVVFRAFATDKESVPQVRQQLNSAIEHARSINRSGKYIFKKISVVIPSNPKFERCDCGEMAQMVRSDWQTENRVQVFKSTKDVFVGAINDALYEHINAGISYTGIISPNVSDAITSNNIKKIISALEDKKVKVAGLALPDLYESVYKRGEIGNTFAFWDLRALFEVDFFDQAHAEQRKSMYTTYVCALDRNGNEKKYPVHGVEEISTLIRLVQSYGPCIGVVAPEVQVQYKAYDTQLHLNKMLNKDARKHWFAHNMQCDMSYIRNGIFRKIE